MTGTRHDAQNGTPVRGNQSRKNFKGIRAHSCQSTFAFLTSGIIKNAAMPVLSDSAENRSADVPIADEFLILVLIIDGAEENLPIVSDALNPARVIPRLAQSRQKHRRQNRDDRNHDQELYKGENPIFPDTSHSHFSRSME